MNVIKKNFIYNSIYQILIIIIPLITTPYISRVIGAEGIGVYSYNYSIANYFSIFIMLGLNNYGNRSIAQIRNNKEGLSKTFFSIYLMQLFMGLIVVALYCIYCFAFSNNLLISLIMMIYVLSNVFDINWLFFGLEKFKLTVTKNIVIKVVSTILIFVFVKSKTDVWKYCLNMVSGMFASQIVLWPYALKIVTRTHISIRDVTAHIKPNLFLFLTVLATSLFKIMDKIMLGVLTNETQVGFYESSEKIIAIPTALIISLGTVMLPRMSHLTSQNDTKTNDILEFSLIFALFLSSSLCFGIMALSKTFVPFFYGTGFDTCIDLFRILLPSCLFLAFANVIRTQYLLPHQMDKAYVISAFIGAGVNLLINILLIPRLQAAGAALGTLAAEAVVCIYQSLCVKRLLPIKTYIKCITPYVISGIVMYSIVYPNNPCPSVPVLSLFLQFVVGVLVYFATLLAQEILYKKISKTSLLNVRKYLNIF